MAKEIPGAKVYYTSPGAPNPRIVDMVAAEKCIDLAPITRELTIGRGREDDSRAPESLRRNPAGSLPYIEFADGSILAETVAICELMEESVPEPALFGHTAHERANCRMWQRRVEQLVVLNQFGAFRFGKAVKVFQSRMPVIPESAAKLRETAKANLKWLDDVMVRSGSPEWINGEFFSIADVQLYCSMDFFASRGQALLEELGESVQWLPGWFARCHSRPSAVKSDPKRAATAKL
uniref:Glutathione S-transferase n=1 Tax=Alexandrium monilatum TaxID=311494 RepID=A0A7S4RH70_9DINO|mmetsp:Transcript_77508/g.230894  ORF Transcript_77508/g.230894 Transcript_77508/m.230894 type:complete len:236 (+) Transcript_77508:77-784(+)|eukprot:CAMPEP_0175253412 /NCGR_PEP_ID=MMETSP0093-20121207/36671_1 /TAXON_ID=311494 /ORGANISM="Alexandrium monilatum, Strain CCMP3105" /LENGTH=235 /DNA_ID=CAMNT_0016547719 /DNA_START=66 /DNA_END=773 /DNA_ORIENTATION=+